MVLILNGDLNIKFRQDNISLNELNKLLLMYNLISTVTFLTRITKNTKSLLGVMIMNSIIHLRGMCFPFLR